MNHFDGESLSAISRVSSYRKELYQYDPGNEATDVGSISNAALLRSVTKNTEAADQLKREPDADCHIGRNIGEEPE